MRGRDIFLAIKNKRLIKLRKAREITQLDVAKAVGLKQRTISAYENGTRTPKPSTMKKIAKFYGVSVLYIFFEEETEGIEN